MSATNLTLAAIVYFLYFNLYLQMIYATLAVSTYILLRIYKQIYNSFTNLRWVYESATDLQIYHRFINSRQVYKSTMNL